MSSVVAVGYNWFGNSLSSLAMLVQDPAATAATAAEVPQQPGFLDMLPMFALMGAVAYFLLFRPQRKQAKEHQRLLDGLEKHDHVRTIGGIVGKVAQVDADHDLIVLTIDESKNVRMRIARQSVAAVLSSEDTPPKIKEEDTAR